MTGNEQWSREGVRPLTPVGEWLSARCAVSSGKVVMMIGAVAFIMACLSIALQAPGQISMDTSIQLYEAFIGQSISFGPPFMSALFKWLGGGLIATSLFVFINTVLLYGSFALVAVSIVQVRRQQGEVTLPLWRALLALLVLVNPLIFLYAGIVWKDVLFASLMASGCACIIAASVGAGYRRYACGLVAIVLLSGAMITRQQGVFMVPVMLLGLIAALWPSGVRQRIYVVVAVIGVFALSLTVLQRQVDATIKQPVNDATSVGLRILMTFDLAGMVSHSDKSASEYVMATTPEQLDAIRGLYSPERVDTLSHTSAVQFWAGQLSFDELKHAWWEMLKQNPQAYLSHRAAVFAKLMGLNGLEGTLPIHIGIEGNETYLAALGIKQERSPRTQVLYDIARSNFSSPIYRHAFWAVMLIVVMALGAYARLSRRVLVVGAMIGVATALMYASYLPTAIAADFRYLFGAIPLVTVLALVVLLGGTSRQR